MELFPLTLPKSNICMETELYYRSNHLVQYNEQAGQISFDKKTVLTLDTYFNCFSYQKYLQYTSAHILEAHLQLQGEVQLRLMKAELCGKKIQRTTLLTQTVRQEQLAEAILLYDFSKETGNGILYLELTALSKTVVFAGGFYASPVLKEQINPTKLAAVICTYKREQYVQRNLEHLRQTIFIQQEQEIARHLEIFVVDNGQTLQKEAIEQENVRLFPNKNYGGSGGFTRGIIEALRRKEEFSHVLLMDDDILLESNVLVKTIRFLQLVRPEHQDLAIGGSMLRLDDMKVQHEAGGKWTGYKVNCSRANNNLLNVSSLLENENFAAVDFCGWWYIAIPLVDVDENKLPMPYFIKNDDVEYGIRIAKKLDFLNGVGIWHAPFQIKEALPLEYYYVRNILITNSIHDVATWRNCYLLIRRVGKYMLRKEYHAISIHTKAINDFFQGFQQFKQIESDVFHQQLIKQCKQLEKNQKNSLKNNFFITGFILIAYCAKLLLLYPKKAKQYKAHYTEVTNTTFWNEKLEC